jgi:hypothetical protein
VLNPGDVPVRSGKQQQARKRSAHETGKGKAKRGKADAA